jgi:DNA-binding MarR family transcriptional regulator
MLAGPIGIALLLPWRQSTDRAGQHYALSTVSGNGFRLLVTQSLRDMNSLTVTGFHARRGAIGAEPSFVSGKVSTMITNEVSDGLAGILRTAIVELVRRDGPDLSARQLGVFLTCYLETEAQTVRGLAAKLGVSKPAITRALDRLSEFDLVRRKTDPLDRRSVLVQRTATGMAFLRELRTILRDAASAMRITAEPAQARPRSSEVRASTH